MHAYGLVNKEKLCARSRTYHIENKEKLCAQKRARLAANKEEAKTKNHAYYHENKGALNRKHRAYYQAHKEKATAYERARRLANPAKDLDRTHKRRAEKIGAFVESVKRSIVFARDEGFCGICYTKVDPDDWHLDHVVPFARGGLHSYDNVQVSHPTCNLAKGAKL